MGQFALPLSLPGETGTVVVGPSLQSVLAGLAASESWPFRTAILAGPPRSGKSLLARWFAGSAAGETVDDADQVDENVLFHRWNRAQADGRPLLLVSSRAPGEWNVALPDLASRLGAALLLEIGPPDDELLAGLIEVHAVKRGLALPDGATDYLLPRIERSHAAVETLLGTIDRLSLERKSPVTISLLREALAAKGAGLQPRLL
jgi:hypothetical protein